MLQSSSANQHRATHSVKSKNKKSKSPKRTARSDGETSPVPARPKKSKKKKVASAERAPSSDHGSKSKDAASLDTDEKLSSSAESKMGETSDASKHSMRVTLRSSAVAGASPKRTFGPRTPPWPEPASVSQIAACYVLFMKSCKINR